MTEIEDKTICKFCNVSYPANKEYFQLRNNIVCLKQKCKECRRIQMKIYDKEKRPLLNGLHKQDRREYMKDYNKLRSEKMKIYNSIRRKKAKEAKLLLLSLTE
jgi:hypothetical protein